MNFAKTEKLKSGVKMGQFYQTQKADRHFKSRQESFGIPGTLEGIIHGRFSRYIAGELVRCCLPILRSGKIVAARLGSGVRLGLLAGGVSEIPAWSFLDAIRMAP